MCQLVFDNSESFRSYDGGRGKDYGKVLPPHHLPVLASQVQISRATLIHLRLAPILISVPYNI